MKKFGFLFFLMIFLLLPTKIMAESMEIGNTKAYYKHPISGVVEDPGNNQGIGQGMVESVLYPQALFEEIEGRYFLSVRYNMANHIGNETFAVQERGQEDFYSVDYEITKSEGDTKDYRFEVPGKNIIVRGTFYVDEMGRDIIFYYDVSNYVPGNTNFISLIGDGEVEKNQPNPPQPVASSSQKVISSGGNTKIKENVGVSKKGDKIQPSSSAKEKNTPERLGYDHGLLMKGSKKLNNTLNPDKVKEGSEQEGQKAPLGEITKALIYTLIVIIAFFTVVISMVAIISLMYLKKLEAENQRILEGLYEE